MVLRESARDVVREVIVFWKKVGLPTQTEQKMIEKLENLHKEWNAIVKNHGKSSNRIKEEEFESSLDDLFDVAHANVLSDLAPFRARFLQEQRQPGRPGNLSDLDLEIEKEKSKQLLLSKRLSKSEADKKLYVADVELSSSEGSFSQSQGSIGSYSNVDYAGSSMDEDEESTDQPGPSRAKKTRATINVMSERLMAALDKCKISSRDAVHLIFAIARALKFDTNTLNVNKSSIDRCRKKQRELRAQNIKKQFGTVQLDAAVLHWDGKLLPGLLRCDKVVDRLPVVISNGDTEKLLGVPALEDGKGKTQANAINEVLIDWSLSDVVKAFCCDTTNSNLGHLNGVATLLEQLLEKDVLYFACRHHIFELILRCVFDTKMPPSTGPDIPIFKRFEKFWPQIDLTKFSYGIDDDKVKNLITPTQIEEINSFVSQHLKIAQPRDDYKEFLELVQIFLGKVPFAAIKFHPPGAMHHARWMAKAIYSLKMYLFRDSFKMSAKETTSIREICVFIVLVYVQAWFTAPFAIAAPNHDLKFLKKLREYRNIDKKVSEKTLRKFQNHLWYLNPESSALAFFDEDVSVSVKRKMVLELKSSETEDDECQGEEEEIQAPCPKRIILNAKDVNSVCEQEMDYFITPASIKFFRRFKIDESFLETDPILWPTNEKFQEATNVLKKLKVVNDIAERAVLLMKEYNNILTKNEDQKQYCLQVLTEYRKNYPDVKKATLSKDF